MLEDRRCPRKLVIVSINPGKKEVKIVQKIVHVHTLKRCESVDGLRAQFHSLVTSELVESE